MVTSWPMHARELPILVTGGSGALARMVLHELIETHRVPADQVIATTRRPEKLRDLARGGVVVRTADFDKPETLAVSFAGARRLLLISVAFEVPYVVGRRTRMHSAAIAAAIEAGVPHILYSSAPNPEPGNPAFWHADHYQSELALLNSGAKWTILRVWDWPRVHYQLFWRSALDTGVYRSPTASGGSSYISKEDTASALVAALLSPVSINRRFDLTGPEALTAHDVFQVLEGITHKQVILID